MKNLLVVFCCLFLFAGCFDDTTDSSAPDSTASDSTAVKAPKKEKAIKINASAVVQGNLVEPIFADGVLRTTKTVEIRAKVGGQLNKVLVRDGDTVYRGQLLASIDNRSYKVTLEDAHYAHIQALSQIAAESEEQIDNPEALAEFITNRENLKKDKSLSIEQYNASLLNLELDALKKGAFRQDMFAQRTGLASARASEQRAQLDLEYTEIRAPFSGIVSDLAVVTGEILSTGQAVCNIFDNSKLEAVVNVLEADLAGLAEGRKVLLSIPAVNKIITASVDVISPSLDQTSRTCKIIIRFSNSDEVFRPGMFTRAEIAAKIHTDKLLVPLTAILERDDRPLLFKVNDDRAQWLYVTIGLQNSEWVEITKVHSGGTLVPGDNVVVSNHLTLAHEAKIKVKKVVAQTDRWATEE
ncbi:efflux RND transporter periplasmic adaptor subunit [bacterium]|jgi:membrane fusion protein, multidrug efflux system|nr:efflux RND transporter periplasmic adaptor subunit [bacterium]